MGVILYRDWGRGSGLGLVGKSEYLTKRGYIGAVLYVEQGVGSRVSREHST